MVLRISIKLATKCPNVVVVITVLSSVLIDAVVERFPSFCRVILFLSLVVVLKFKGVSSSVLLPSGYAYLVENVVASIENVLYVETIAPTSLVIDRSLAKV